VNRESQQELPGVTGEELSLMSKEELRQFVDDLVSDRIFTSSHIRPNERQDMVATVFMPVALGAFANWSDTGMANIGVLWEYTSKAGPRCINGYPIFFSMHMVHKDDWAVAVEAAQRERERRKNIEL